MKLLIVESPAKCKKIQGYLGAGWRVQATMGHIRALAEDLKAIGFDPTVATPTWSPTYEAIAAKKDAIASLRREAKGAEVYLGSDDDREGEAIAWHTCAALGLDPATTPRVTFHEITEAALKAAVAAPGRIDMPKFYAQQARTMLDMLIGFTLSPCLWRGVGYKPGLSAGRCQTPALRIIYDRDQLIATHVSTTKWVLSATSEHDLTWTGVEECTEAEATLRKLTPAPHTLVIKERQERIATSQAPAPFITSSLQQEASSRLSMNPKVTMRCAQTLYEAGHITYMRTDNPVLSAEAKDAAIAVVMEKWGATYVGGEPVKKVVKKKAAASKVPEAKPEAQAAHEGIRPTHMETTEVEGVQEQRLYTLIWNRTLQSVMAPETRDVVTLKATPTADPTLLLTTEWDQTRFAGWRILDAERKAEEEAAAAAAYTARKPLTESKTLKWSTFTVTESPTTPPSRYKEAALIRELEHKGIGRPSTYATLVETVLERGYVEKATTPASPVTLKGWLLNAGAKEPVKTTKTKQMGGERDILRTTALGRTVIEWLLTTFGDMLDYGFTAAMEQQLDEVAKGTKPWAALLTDTWSKYRDTYTKVMSTPKAEGSATTTTTRANVADFGDGYKMVVSRKGPLFVLEKPDEKTRFAPVPTALSLQTATRADAEAAFAATEGETLGSHEGNPVVRKKGPYGFYVSCGTQRLNCTATETFAEICLRLTTKTAAAPGDVNHTVGPYRIKKGPYGLYMFKATTGAKKPTFVSIPEETPWSTLTVEGAETLYKYSLENKPKAKAPSAKWKSKAKDSPGH
jgi:DNA topoisomerase-1